MTAVLDRLGKGSRTTIAKHLNTWSEERVAKLVPLAIQVSEQMAEVVGPMREAMEQIAKSVEELGAWRTKSLGLPTGSIEQARKALEQLGVVGEELRRSLVLNAAIKAAEDARESLKVFEGYGKQLGTTLGKQAEVLESARAAVASISPPTFPNTAGEVAGIQPTTFPEAGVSNPFNQIARRLERIEERIEERLNSVESVVLSRNSESES